MPLIRLKTLKNPSFVIFFRKKVYCGNIQCFLFIVWWKQWNKQKIIKKLTFSVKRNFFLEIAYIPFFGTKIKMVFLWKDVSSPSNAGNGIIYATLREKNELPWKVYIFLVFSFIFMQNMKIKGKNTEKLFFLKKYLFFNWNDLYYILMLQDKVIFFKMLLKQIKRFK